MEAEWDTVEKVIVDKGVSRKSRGVGGGVGGDVIVNDLEDMGNC